ncbi:hypothetical protein K144316041_p20860 (plasmid) [Clostridium tetani]|uniref:hypothetical protein n=1 Tax=Clostridium tetani TaxID=1513 RepID=UPI0029541312|nr:hypothetical protein [Clostridium tetani]BDR74247.1 hypothetical protein K144316041_p20860 [Clostridium tetani]
MNIRLRIKLKEIKDNLIKSWYRLMTPIANAIIKYEEYSHSKREKEVKQWTDEYAIKRCAKLVVKRLIGYSKDYECELNFDVSEWCNYDFFNGQTIRTFIVNQDKDKKLKLWGYEKISIFSVDRIEELTDLLKKELEKYDMMIDCECITGDYIKQSWRAREYRKTLVVRLKQ